MNYSFWKKPAIRNFAFLSMFLFNSSVFSDDMKLADIEKEDAWLAFGDLRGHIEPCGCDPSSDLGGVERLAALVSRERVETPNLELFSLGNNFEAGNSPEAISKNFFMNQALYRIRPSAYLLNLTELLQYEKLAGPGLKPRFVLSNKTAKVGYAENYVDLGKTLVFGYVYFPEIEDKVTKVSPSLIEEWRLTLKRSGKQRSVLLFSGNDDDLKVFVKANIFTDIISSNPKSLSADFDLLEKNNPNLLIRNSDPKLVRSVPLAGQGVLRGGSLRSERAKSLVEIFSEPGCKSNGNTSSLLLDKNCSPPSADIVQNFPLSWLDQSYQSGVPVQIEKILQDYHKAQTKLYESQLSGKKALLKDTPFAGAHICKDCHSAEYSVWEISVHASAFKTLEDKNQSTNPECVSCHVLGFKDAGGFISKAETPQFADVQCENCHGPALAHSKNPGGVKPISALHGDENCRECHQGLHSPKFIFSEYWKSIVHGKKEKEAN